MHLVMLMIILLVCVGFGARAFDLMQDAYMHVGLAVMIMSFICAGTSIYIYWSAR